MVALVPRFTTGYIPKTPPASEAGRALLLRCRGRGLDAREKRDGFAEHMAVRQAAPDGIREAETRVLAGLVELPGELVKNPVRRIRQHRQIRMAMMRRDSARW